MSAFPAELSGEWDLDSAHSTIGFAVKHALVTTTRGRFDAYTGGATIDAANPSKSSVWFDAKLSSVNTGNEQRDGHLRSADFFNTEANDKLAFRSTSVEVKGDDIVTVGDLTIGEVTHPVTVTWEWAGSVVTDPFGATKSGFEGRGELSRKDWGLTWNAPIEAGGVLVSDKVKLVLDIQITKKV